MRLACIAFVTCAALGAQTIEVTPSRVLVDQPAVIHVSGAQPNEGLTIRAELVDGSEGGAGGRWASQSEFVADADGRIDTARQAPVGGSYKEVSAMGPVWSMKPVASGSASNKEGRYEPPRQFGVQTIEFHLIRGTNVVSTANLEQTPIGEGVQLVTLREDGLRGILAFRPATRHIRHCLFWEVRRVDCPRAAPHGSLRTVMPRLPWLTFVSTICRESSQAFRSNTSARLWRG